MPIQEPYGKVFIHDMNINDDLIVPTTKSEDNGEIIPPKPTPQPTEKPGPLND